MTWDLDQAKADLGIDPSDTSMDAAIQRQMDAVLSSVETYCDRRFLFARETAYFPAQIPLSPPQRLFSLPRYPIGQIYGTTYNGYYGTGTVTANIVQPDTGMIAVTYYGTEPYYYYENWPANVSVDYEGGYDELPPDLEMCLWEMFQARWAATGGTGSMANLGGAVAASGIRTVAIPNVISMAMGNGSSSSSGSGGGVSIAGLPQAYAGTLDLYRRITV